MYSRRKVMWKLLYNLVNRNNSDLDDVFNFVDEIICKQPSLIRCYLANKAGNQFQETFIIWLVNKFVKYLEDDCDEQKRAKNVQQQQKILLSCLRNDPKLFGRLLHGYVDALKQLAGALSEMELDECEDTENDGDENTFKCGLRIFTCDTEILRDIDPECTFQIINLSLNNADMLVMDFLSVLQYLLPLGYAYHPNLFIDSLKCTLETLRECDVPVKFACLKYCRHVLQQTTKTGASDCQAKCTHYATLTLRGISIMWRAVPKWSLERFMVQTQADDFINETCDWLPIIREGYLNVYPHGQHNFNLCCLILERIAEFKSVPPQTWHRLAHEMLQFYLSQSHAITISESHMKIFLRLSQTYATLLPLLAAICVNGSKVTYTKSVLDHLYRGIQQLLTDIVHTQETYMQLLQHLSALKFLEHKLCQQQQIAFLQQHPQPKTTSFYEQAFSYEMQTPATSVDWNTLVKQYLDSKSITDIHDIELLLAHQNIISLLLQIVCLRNQLKPRTQRMILGQLEWPIKNKLSSNLTDVAVKKFLPVNLKLLCCVMLDMQSSNFAIMQSVLTALCRQIFTGKDEVLCEVFCSYIPHLYAAGYLNANELLHTALNVAKDKGYMFAAVLRVFLCCADTNCARAYKCSSYGRISADLVLIECSKCGEATVPDTATELVTYLLEHDAVWLPWPKSLANQPIPKVPKQLYDKISSALLFSGDFAFALQHLDLLNIKPSLCLNELAKTSAVVGVVDLSSFSKLLPVFAVNDDNFLKQLADVLLKCIVNMLSVPLHEQDISCQRHMLNLIVCCAYEGIEEKWLFHFFKLTFFFLMHAHSLVMQEAVLSANELCAKQNLVPISLWNWYRRDALGLVVQIALHAYLTRGVRLSRSLRAFTKMLGFSCVQEFVCKYHRLLTTMILPYCIKQPRCKGAVVVISKLTRKPITSLFIASFLRIYTHIYLSEKADIGNKCIELIVSSTASSFQKLMNADVKQTVSEILIYFNRNPTFVMRSFQCLLLQKGDKFQNSQAATAEFSKFIADRFLGVITHFESCLSEPYFEKPLKEEVLYSLGQILRFVGANHVTQFRFKIIAMLSFVSSLNDPHLQRITLKIWNIFLHTVNVQELGSSLSCIVAQLQPLLEHSNEEVNAIYEFLILKNASMLSAHLSDLYFLESERGVKPAISKCISRQTEILRSDKLTLVDKLGFLYKQITNENLQVRVYGLKYLTNFIAANRKIINRVVLSEILSGSIIERTVDVLIDGCQHENRNLRLASSKCLGELGAIDASYMPSNYNFEQVKVFPLSILTDDFTIMALNELCRAYQFQKETKYVDTFSLAIQETLAVCGISPKEKKKIALWNQMPERMRQIMEPLLDSCYTGSRRQAHCKEHPLFGSSFCKTYADWAFTWASRLIDYVQSADTKHLLTSYKPSIKRDNNTMTTFFPYILLHALQECNETQTQRIYEEFLRVFTLCCSNANGGDHQNIDITKRHKRETQNRRYKEFHSKKYTADLNATVGCGSVAGGDKRSVNTDHSQGLPNQVRMATKLCSEQIDFLQRWLREFKRHKIGTSKDANQNDGYDRVQKFIAAFDKLLISRANFNCGEYARALMYMEEYIELQPRERLHDEFSFLIDIYGRLMDVDSVEGAVHVRSYNLNVEQEIVVNRLTDRQQDMITCYEKLLSSSEHMQPEHVRGMIDSYLRMDTPKTALLITDGLWQRLADQYMDDYFKECKSELLWRLGNYDELSELLKGGATHRSTCAWPIQCAEACLNFREPAVNVEQFAEQLDTIRYNLLESVRTCSLMKQHLYAHSYDEVLKLHLLNEMEKYKKLLNHICQVLNGESSANDASAVCLREMTDFFADWNARLEIMQPSVRVLDPLFGFRRNLLIESKRVMCQVAPQQQTGSDSLLGQLSGLIDGELGRLWISSARINRNAGNLQRAQLSIMKATDYEPETLFLEKVKLLWQKGDQTISLKLLEEHLEKIESHAEGKIKKLPPMELALYGKAKYLQATYNAESMNICAELNLRYFKEAIASNVDSEKCYVQMAHYLEKMYESLSEKQRDEEHGRATLVNIMLQYAKSLRCGCENVYQSLPRLLSLWLDTTSRFMALSQQDANAAGDGGRTSVKLPQLQELARKTNDIMSNSCNSLPIAIFYTAFSQLLSRICHPSGEVFAVLRTIIIKLIEHYPQQSLWMLLPMLKSSFTNRIKRCKLIFVDPRLGKPEFKKVLNDFSTLTERLIELTNKEVAFDQTYTMSTLVKQLPKLFSDSKFTEILLPFEKYMQPSFPISSTASRIVQPLKVADDNSPGTSKTSSVPTNLFPHKQIYIRGFREEITVLRSAARPKKITIRCSDGHDYDVMVKPKDDLRKDFRLMEFNGLVKRHLHQDLQARHRRLRIRTYAVIPFNEECGLVEWIPKLNSFRGICMQFYRARGLGIPDRQLRAYSLPVGESIEKKRSVFVDKLLANHPPVFHEWFRYRFATPHTWYEARNAYVKTIAVMSMVGYILGLGDRHGENILFDECNGDAVHVDFNCLFNRGELFAYPELVPFRLTQNMIAAMGPLGVEGTYRKCCEITLRILKQEAKTLMSVLRPFVYDLVVQSRNYVPKATTSAELTDPKATADVRRIADRLQGHVKTNQANSIPLSIEGQVNFLIAEASSLDNLAAMYIGWNAFL